MQELTGPRLFWGTAETCVDIRYLTGFAAVDPVLLVMRGRSKLLVVPSMEVGRARRQAHGTAVCSPNDLPLLSRKSGARRYGLSALRALKKFGARRTVVSQGFPVGIVRDLEKAGISVQVSDKPMCPQREVKSAGEIRKLEDAQEACVTAMRAAVKLIAKSRATRGGKLIHGGKVLTSETVRRTIEETLIRMDCAARETIVSCGSLAADPHERGHGPLLAGKAIVIDIFPRHSGHGYWGDLTRTVVKGKASPALGKMYNAVLAAQRAALRRVRAGVSMGRVHRAVLDEFESRGFKTECIRGRPAGFIHSTGHGVGLEIHEGPNVVLSNRRLRVGNVVTIEPGLYYPGIGGVRIEDTIVVTRSGWRHLALCGKRFEL